MRVKTLAYWSGLFLMLMVTLAVARPSAAQIENGSISGKVLDPSIAVVPGAAVTATSTTEGVSTNATTNAEGEFTFPDLAPGPYTITVEAKNFQKYVQENVVLHASEKLSLATITLVVGAPSETVTVTAQQTTLQTEGAERSDTVENTEIQNIGINGRNPLALISLLPGVSGVVEEPIAGTGGIQNFSANGTRNNSNNLTINGIGDIDTGLNGDQNVTISTDSIQEFTALTGIYDAQYGRSSGTQINEITKTGTTQFHGSLYWYHRNESMNANNAFNKEEAADLKAQDEEFGAPYVPNPGFARPLLRLNDPGYTIGGPVYVPGHFNSAKDKLFFFVSQEFQRQLEPGTLGSGFWIPTAAETTGDFSGDGLASFIKDPLSSLPCTPANTSANPGGCFDGLKNGVPTIGVIPANRLYAPGVAFLKLMNGLDPTAPPVGVISSVDNYFIPANLASAESPRTETLVRIDYNATSRLHLNGSYINNINTTSSHYGELGPAEAVPLTTILTPTPGYQWNIGGNYIISSSMIDDFNFGISNNSLNSSVPSIFTTAGPLGGANAFPSLFPSAVRLNQVPEITYGDDTQIPGGGGGGSINPSQSPFSNYNTDIDATDNLTKVWGPHTFKTGLYVQRSRKDQTTQDPFNGDYNFQSGGGNPYDTGNGLANTLLGVFDNYTQSSAFLDGAWRYFNIEGYFQDTWKITPSLTIMAGLRLQWYQPTYDSTLTASSFEPTLFNPATAVHLFEAAPTIALIVPGSGNPSDGMAQAGHGFTKYLQDDRAPQIAPRLGIAWDITGKQRFVLRTGAGLYYDRIQGNRYYQMLQNPPEEFQPLVQFGCLDPSNCPAGASTINPSAGGTSSPQSPPTIFGAQPQGKIPNVLEYSFGVQTKLPGQMVLDTSYVGSQSRHLTNLLNLNGIPYGATFRAASQDPTLLAILGPACFNPATAGFEGMTGGYSGACALPENLLRKYPGYADIWQYTSSGMANYNSLQVSLKRSVGRQLFLQAAYTYSKILTDTPQGNNIVPGTAEGLDFENQRIDGLTRQFNYTYGAFDQRHNLVVNYVYSFPSIFASGVKHTLIDGWQVSGTARFATGNPYHVDYVDFGTGTSDFQVCVQSGCFPIFTQYNGDPTITGSYTEGAHLSLTGKPIKGVGFLHQLNPAAFAEPMTPNIGNQPLETAYGPGWNNWDMSLQKNFAVRERYTLQLRVDAFNVFNHTQWSGVNSLAEYVFGGLINGVGPGSLPTSNTTDFGTFSGARDPRVLQTVVRFQF
jgi:Carboxypeptidase regulatory-like domain